MCGIAGIFNYSSDAPPIKPQELERICSWMEARGPDGSGSWVSENGRVALGHRRLAIIDLSDRAAQPMLNNERTVAISFNGEIYNYLELRNELVSKGVVFRTKSDTEVLLHLYIEKGKGMLDELSGMFSFIIWDGRSGTFFMARDPYGIKPLYYADNGSTIRAASSVKALLAGGQISRTRSSAGSVGFFLWGSVPEPHTYFQDIKALPAGTFLSLVKGPSKPQSYTSVNRIFSSASETGKVSISSVPRIISQFRDALVDSLKSHFIADVPVGIFLSSGIDSSVLLQLAKEIGVKDITALTLTFNEFSNTASDEAPLAQQMCSRSKVEHRIKNVTKQEFTEDEHLFFSFMDQPSIDGVNTWLISKFAKKNGLKVCLSGLGADELLGGYSSFADVPRLASISGLLPLPSWFRVLVRKFMAILTPSFQINPKIAGVLEYGNTFEGAYFLKRALFLPWELSAMLPDDEIAEGLQELGLPDSLRENSLEGKKNFLRVAALESSLYMRNQLLRDADWAGMAHSIEIRVPYVHVDLLARVVSSLSDMSILFRRKEILSRVLSTPLPESILNKPKTGFTVPVSEWLKSEEKFSAWRSVPSLSREDCSWARRWAYVVSHRFMESLPT